MEIALYPIPILAIVVFFLIRAELREDRKNIYFLKPLATLLVIAMACLSYLDPAHDRFFSAGILVGLLFSFGGDIALMFQDNRRAFTLGLGLFLLAQVVYTVIFQVMGRFSGWDVLSGVLLLGFGAFFFSLIRSNLGKMRLPVIVYILVISLMVSRAISVFSGAWLSRLQGILVVLGAVLFYISDVLLAAGRFWKPWRYHRISLAFYYSGQALLALSASYFVW